LGLLLPLDLIYADRQKGGRPLDEESFQGFQHFGRQATIGLSLITRKESPAQATG
jgi:hypothetical protein